MSNKILESEALKYRVVLNGQVLTEAPSRPIAEGFVAQLSNEQQQEAKVIPVTSGGQQVLFG